MQSKDADNEDTQTPHPTEWLQDAQSQVHSTVWCKTGHEHALFRYFIASLMFLYEIVVNV